MLVSALFKNSLSGCGISKCGLYKKYHKGKRHCFQGLLEDRIFNWSLMLYGVDRSLEFQGNYFCSGGRSDNQRQLQL